MQITCTNSTKTQFLYLYIGIKTSIVFTHDKPHIYYDFCNDIILNPDSYSMYIATLCTYTYNKNCIPRDMTPLNGKNKL